MRDVTPGTVLAWPRSQGLEGWESEQRKPEIDRNRIWARVFIRVSRELLKRGVSSSFGTNIMPDVAFVCVRKNLWRAEALAEIFARKGFSIGDAKMSDAALRGAGAVVMVWSEQAADSEAFLALAERASEHGNAVVASLMELHGGAFGDAPVFDISAWNGGVSDPVIAGLVAKVTAMVKATRPVGPVLAHQRAMRAQRQAQFAEAG